MKPKPLRAVFTGTRSPYLCYGQTGDLYPMHKIKSAWRFYPDGDSYWMPVFRHEFYCPAMGDRAGMNPTIKL